MGYSARKKLFLMMTTSMFITIGMLAYSSEKGHHKSAQTPNPQSLHLRDWEISQRRITPLVLPKATTHLQVLPPHSYIGTAWQPFNQSHLRAIDLPPGTDKSGKSNNNDTSTTLKADSAMMGGNQTNEIGSVRKLGVASSQLMEERRQLIQSVCSSSKTAANQPPSIGSVLYNAKYKFYYCPVEKVASTFWRRFIYQLQYTSPVKSPFDVPIMTALRGMGNLHLPPKQRSGQELAKLLNESTKLLFVRDPHSRIFSAFVDKLLAPNPYYWKVWALPAIMRFRPHHHDNKPHGHAHCGHDVTFVEFVKYVINIAASKDGHVMPINRMCTPCSVPYTVIGKMESFADDINLLFDSLHLNTTPLRMSSMKQETTIDAMADSATDALSGGWLASSLKCITKEAVLQRIWRKNQIRGFISWKQNLNLTSQQIQYMKSGDFIKLLNIANSLSTDKRELKLQKSQALREAFATLDGSTLSDISKIYGDDIKLFGYSENPSWLQDLHVTGFTDTKAFDYTQPWDLSTILDTSKT